MILVSGVNFLVLMIIVEDFHLCLISFSCHHECMLIINACFVDSHQSMVDSDLGLRICNHSFHFHVF